MIAVHNMILCLWYLQPNIPCEDDLASYFLYLQLLSTARNIYNYFMKDIEDHHKCVFISNQITHFIS